MTGAGSVACYRAGLHLRPSAIPRERGFMLRSLLSLVTGLSVSTGPAGAVPAKPPLHKVVSLKVTILSTMLAEEGMGKWGFSALVEADGHRILFDTGLHPETVLQNARELGIDLSSVTDVVLSHHHGDHTGGLLALRRELMKTSPTAIFPDSCGAGNLPEPPAAGQRR